MDDLLTRHLSEILWWFAAIYAVFLLLLIRRENGFGIVTARDLRRRLDKIVRFIAALYIAVGMIWAIFVLPIKALTGTIPTLGSLVFMLLAITVGYIANKAIFRHWISIYIFAILVTVLIGILAMHYQDSLKDVLRSSFL